MINKYNNILTIILLALPMVVSLVSCSGEDEQGTVDEQLSIAFSSTEAETELMTRAAEKLGRDFVVYGYKNVDEDEQLVFDGYAVKYLDGSANTSEDNTHGYFYVVGAQTIKYWDFGAKAYNFWGYTGDKSQFTNNGTTLTIPVEQSVSEPDVAEKMFSALYHRSPISSDVVQLQFKKPYAKVRVLFYTNATLTDKSFENIKISDIKFGPESPKQIITSGNLKVSYPKKGEGPETYSTEAPTSKADKLTFNEVMLDHAHGTDSNNAVTAVPTGGTEFYYVVPNNNATSFTLSAKIDNEDKTAEVPANFMDWRSNFVYTYIFKISGGRYIELYDVQIDPWKYGGSQEEEWKNW
ncbi:MAG: fimbrillin family protein [Prevotellaceae bacterium]|nr:fimbrillin family protein [Candidatus Minthosoma caballi]